MILTDLKQVKAIQANLRTRPLSDTDNMKYLEQICGWYDFYESEPHLVQMMQGKRQVLALLKTILEQPAEVIVRLAKEQEG